MKAKTIYEATDGTHHDTAEACRAYERAKSFEMLIGLTGEALETIIDGSWPEGRAALFAAYNAAQDARREKGEMRPRKKKGEA